MKVLVVYSLLLTLVVADTGGEEAVLKQFPYQAAVKLKVGTSTAFCGGTLISNQSVLTAAHCCEVAEEAEVILGSVLIQEETEPSRVSIMVPLRNIKIHEQWSKMTLTNDICIIKLTQAVTLNDYIAPAILPPDDSSNYLDDVVIASGWGRDSDKSTTISSILRYVESTIIANAACNSYYFGIIKDTHICMSGSGGKSTCNGDSGGPLILKSDNRTLVGITSFGISFGCEIGWPPAFTRVSKYLQWIESNMS